MSRNKHLSLQVIARTASNGGWNVDIIDNGTLTRRNMPLADPLTSDQASACRWYLEKYVKESPFSREKAMEAEMLLNNYPNELLRQLSLRQLLLPHLEAGAYSLGSVLLSINIIEDEEESPENSIHRLFWETLEHPELWDHPRWTVVVHRAIRPRTGDTMLDHEQVKPQFDANGVPTFNVLLVIARDVERNPGQHHDINPYVAANVLLALRDRLCASGNRTKLNVEIVRPGTLGALKEHLGRSSPGHFHLVHFDMHGMVGIPKRTRCSKVAYLRFSHPTTYRTQAVLGYTVGAILKQHKVPFVVLNACDSAQANYTGEANMAAQFLRNGILSVVGMSFKIASSAAAMFLEHFYHALFLKGDSFAIAAAAGRKALLLNPVRPARYGLQRPLSDHFVAVAYGSDVQLSLAESSSHKWLFPKCQPILPPSLDLQRESLSGQRIVIGREFDILRLEKALLLGRIVYLSGLWGIGKTALLEQAGSIWKSTGFVKATVIIDFNMRGNLSGREFLLSILHQLLAQLHSSVLGPIDSLDNNMIYQNIEETLLGIDSVVVIDGLENALLYPIIGVLAKTQTIEVIPYIKRLLRLAQSRDSKGRCHVIISHRRANPRVLGDLLGYEFAPSEQYQLDGLELPDAIELSQRILQSSGEDTQHWEYEDGQWLESVVELLQCIPSALHAILPLQNLQRIPWRQFYIRVHKGLFLSTADLDSVPQGGLELANELRQLSAFMPHGRFFLLCLMSNYWHKSVGVDSLLAIFNKTAQESLKQSACDRDWIISWRGMFDWFILDRGYIRPGHDGVTLEVHPLFTILGRAFQSKFVTLSNRVQLKAMVCNSLEALCSQAALRKHDGSVGDANALTTIEFCLHEVPAQDWPLSLLEDLASQKPTHLPHTLQTLLQAKHLQLLREIPYKFPLLERKARHVAFFSFVLTHFSSLDNASNSQVEEEILELCSKGLQLLTSWNPNEDASLIPLCQAHFLWAATTSALALGKHAECYRNWQALKSMKDEMELPSVPEVEQALTAVVINDLSSLDAASSLLSESATLSCLKGLAYWRHRLAMGIKILEICEDQYNLLSSRAGVESHGQKDILESLMDEMFSELNSTNDVGTDLIDIEELVSGLLTFDERDLPITPLPNISSLQHQLESLEDTYHMGDWRLSVTQHLEMATDATKRDRFQEAENHLEAIEALLVKVSAPRSLLDAARNCRMGLVRKNLAYLFDLTMYPTRYFEKQENGYFIQLSDEPHNLRPIDSEDRPAIDVRWPDKDQMAEFQAMPRKWWAWWQKFQGQDPSCIAHIYANDAVYKTEVKLLDKIFVATSANKPDEALSLLDQLEALCTDNVFMRYPVDISPLLSARDCFEVILEQKRLLALIGKTMKNDLKASRAAINKLDCTRPKFCTWVTDNMIEGLWFTTDKFEFMQFQSRLRRAAADEQPQRLKDLYKELVGLLNTGYLSHIRPQDTLAVRMEALTWLFEWAGANKLWEDGMAYCDEYLELTRPSSIEFPRMQDDCLLTRDLYEWRLMHESLARAEATRNFDKCLQLLNGMEAICARQRATPGVPRSLFFFLGDRALAFWKDSYRNHCLSCARWVRQIKPEEQITEPERPGNDDPDHVGNNIPRAFRVQLANDGASCGHNRRQFERPFGCEHHCQGGYCFQD